MKLFPCPISLAAALCAALLFSCSPDSSEPPTPNEGISSSSKKGSSSPAEAVPNYCVYIAERLCLRGTNPCLGNGIPSDDCPFPDAPPLDPSSDSGSPNGSNSSGVKQSSSSGAKPSSASVAPSSNSAVPSSPSTTTSSTSIAQSSNSTVPSSPSTTPSSSSIVQSSSSAIPSSSSNITVCKDKLGRYLYCAWGGNYYGDGTLVLTNECYALDPEYSDLEEPTCEKLIAHCDRNGAGGWGPATWFRTSYIGALYAGPYIEIDDDSFSCREGGRDKYGDPWSKPFTGPYKLEQIEL